MRRLRTDHRCRLHPLAGRSILALALLALLVTAGAGAAEAPRVETLDAAGQEWTFQGASPSAGADVSVIHGDIVILPAADQQLRVTARRMDGNGGPIHVLWAEQGGTSVVCTSYAEAPRGAESCAYGREREIEGPGNKDRVELTVRLPAGIDLRARTVNGDVRVEGWRNDLALGSVTGTVSALHGSGDLSVETVSGSVEIADVEAKTLRVDTLSGDVHWSGRLAAGSSFRINSYSGQVRLQPAGGADGTVDLSTRTGRLRAAQPVERTDEEGQRRYRVALGSGAGELRVETHSGDVTLVDGES